MVKDLLNYVEDRRIDYFVFTNSLATKVTIILCMTNTFTLKLLIRLFKSSEYTSSDWDSYIFRIINLTNKNSDLDALPDLRKIRKLIFSNVKSLNSTEEALNIALDVFHILLENFRWC